MNTPLCREAAKAISLGNPALVRPSVNPASDTPIPPGIGSSPANSVTTVLMSTSVAAAAAFLTPIATPTNLMVMGPGGYAFGDYWKLGLPLLVWFLAVSVFIVPVIWPF